MVTTENNTLSGMVFMDISNLSEINWIKWQFIVMIPKHDLANEVLIDIKRFDNIYTFERWFNGICVPHPSNNINDYFSLNNQLF